MEDKGYVSSRKEIKRLEAIGLPRRFYKLTKKGTKAIISYYSKKVVKDLGKKEYCNEF
jgi:DNA-binding PadR family transcriptional regulator